MSTTVKWTEGDTDSAQRAWAEYQRLNDVSALHGQVVGIDPVTGKVWFGSDLASVTESARREGVETPLLCLRVGSDYYQRKGGRR